MSSEPEPHSKSNVHSTQIQESELAALIARHKRMNRLSLSVGGSGLVLQLALGIFGDPTSGILVLLAIVLLIVGFNIYARMRGLSGWLGILGLLGLLGVIALMMIPPRCLACGARVRDKFCVSCRAPGSP